MKTEKGGNAAGTQTDGLSLQRPLRLERFQIVPRSARTERWRLGGHFTVPIRISRSGVPDRPVRKSGHPMTAFPPIADVNEQGAGGPLVPSRPGEFHPEPLTGRVEDWRAGLGRSLWSLLSRSFDRECHSISTMPRFQSPPRRTQHADFPHYALLLASPQSLWTYLAGATFGCGRRTR